MTIDDNFHNSDNCFCHFDNWKDNPWDLWYLRHWLQFWQVRTRIHDNLCYQTINCDTGQHSQFFYIFQLCQSFASFGVRVRWDFAGIEAAEPTGPDTTCSRKQHHNRSWLNLCHQFYFCSATHICVRNNTCILANYFCD